MSSSQLLGAAPAAAAADQVAGINDAVEESKLRPEAMKEELVAVESSGKDEW
jgi:hypothetical protein